VPRACRWNGRGRVGIHSASRLEGSNPTPKEGGRIGRGGGGYSARAGQARNEKCRRSGPNKEPVKKPSPRSNSESFSTKANISATVKIARSEEFGNVKLTVGNPTDRNMTHQNGVL